MEKESLKNEDARHHFFKIIHGEELKQHLRIPPAFMKHLSQEMSNIATLTGPSGSHWRVTVSTDANGTYLRKGWKQFMKENNLGDSEFLTLRYDGNMQFYVKIFDKSGVQRLPALVSGNRTQEETRISNGKKAQGGPRKSPAGSLNLKKLQLHINSGDGSGESSRIGKTATSFTSKSPHFMIGMTKCNVEKNFLLPIPQSFSAAGHFPPSKMRVVLSNSAGKAWDVSCIYRAGRHYFSGGWGPFARYNNLKQGDVCIFELVDKDKMQYVPADTLQGFNIALPPRVLLRDPHGRSWLGDVSVRKDGRTWTGGWRAFCKWNLSDKNDCCICQFVLENGHHVDLIAVPIHRAQPRMSPRFNQS